VLLRSSGGNRGVDGQVGGGQMCVRLNLLNVEIVEKKRSRIWRVERAVLRYE